MTAKRPVPIQLEEKTPVPSLPVLHALIYPSIEGVAICAEYITDKPESVRKKGYAKDKPGEYPYSLDHTALKTLIETSFGAYDDLKATRWIIYLPADETVPPSAQFSSKKGPSPKEKKLPLVPMYIPVLLCPYETFFQIWRAAQNTDKQYIPGDSFQHISILIESTVRLIQNGRFKPSAERTFAGYHAQWVPALSPYDMAWVSDFSSRMPPVCRYAIPRVAKDPYIYKPAVRVEKLIVEMMRVIIRSALAGYTLKEETEPFFEPSENEMQFMTDLIWVTDPAKDKGFERNFSRTMQDWLTFSSSGRFAPFEFCMIITDPPKGQTEPWDFTLSVRSEAEPSLLIPAEIIWELPDPQSGLFPQAAYLKHILLAGIGLLTSSSSVLWRHLSGTKPTGGSMTLKEAATFLGSDLARARRKGVTVLLPDWWTDTTYTPRVEIHAQRRNPSHTQTRIGLQELLSFDYRIAIGDTSFSPDEFWEKVKEKAPFIWLGDRWISFNPDAIQHALDSFTRHQSKGGDTTGDLLRLSLKKMEDSEVPVSIHAKDDWVADLLDFFRTETNQAVPVPKKFKGKLRPYQKEGFSFLCQCTRRGFGACLADDMGLGKTPQTLAWLLYLKEKEKPTNPALLICPMSVVGNWEREIQRFAPSLCSWVHHGTDRCKGDEFVKHVGSYDLVLTTYHLAARDLDHLKTVSWSAIILDEAQNIKNLHANQTVAVKSLSGERRVALTGTPVENRLLELWSIMDFLNPGYLGSQSAFTNRYSRPIEQEKDAERIQELRSLIRPFLLRRMKTDTHVIADLPEKMENRVYCTLTPEQATLYQAVVLDMAKNLDNVEGIARKGAILAAITRLKQICNHPGRVGRDKTIKAERSGKVSRLLEMIEEISSEGDSALIFSQYATFAEELAGMIEKQGDTPVLLLTGSTPRKKREQMIEEFQASTTPIVFVISLKAGGTGLNLTKATHVFHVDRWWNPAVEDQATDRTYRIGQKRNVQVHLMITAGTLEERIDLMNQEKRTLAKEVLAHGDEYLTNLSTKELLEIVSLRDSLFSGEEA
ncbi:DEAD/DEAH box helicase [Methanospirillum hungatei]|uniref:DEAD/DEAH box helicase n=1 Tax=Methanospirillum hungatei TaxID=2203 RepID=UPI0026EC2B3C|nr:DEAD/DEAH box helicase [Methanospirillum hungatei]MCA1916681.1 DEAD/DEAH box helicase [Methanospirillum hungatei]